MPVNVVMPQMGESVAEGTVVRWIKKPGDRVERDEPLLEISTDKVDAEIPSPASGVLTKVLVKENQTVEVNTIIAEIDGEEGNAPAELSAETSGRAAPAAASSPAAASGGAGAPTEPGQTGQKVRSSPLVRKMAHEHHIDLSLVSGTGLGGRISKKDVLVYLARSKEGVGQAGAAVAPYAPAAQEIQMPRPVKSVLTAPSSPVASSTPAMIFSGPVHVVPMTPMRRQIAEHMALSKRTAPHVATVFEVEMARVAQILTSHGGEFEQRNGIKLTYTPFLIRAAVEALKQFPIVNASLDGGNIIYKRDVNIGVAVALETGLIVPVIKHADEKSFLGVARSVSDLAGRARSKRLSVEEVLEGTFTISNHGITGSLIGTPIISQPQVAILGVGKIEKRPVVRDDAIAIRTMVYLTLSFDHRVLDGAVGDQFMARIKSALENWDEPVL
ncbi:MAG: dihydrolipoamide acetyltransferase family protein [Terriglobia bacterium]